MNTSYVILFSQKNMYILFIWNYSGEEAILNKLSLNGG